MAIVHYDESGLILYAKFDDSSNRCVALSEGASLKIGRYACTDGAIQATSLPQGSYSVSIHEGNHASPQSSDVRRGTVSRFDWSGTAEVAPVRNDLATELSRIDTNIGSRLASSGYTSPPTAAQNADAVRSEFATALVD